VLRPNILRSRVNYPPSPHTPPLPQLSFDPIPIGEGNLRGGFFIHGGAQPGSAGCVDLMDNDKAMHAFMDEIRNRTGAACCIKVSVKFGANSKSIIQKRYDPWMGPGSTSPWMPN